MQNKIDIDYISRNGFNTYMRRNRVEVELREPHYAMAYIFEDGTMICIGGRNEEEAKKITRIFARKVQKLQNPSIKFFIYKFCSQLKLSSINYPVSYTPELELNIQIIEKISEIINEIINNKTYYHLL